MAEPAPNPPLLVVEGRWPAIVGDIALVVMTFAVLVAVVNGVQIVTNVGLQRQTLALIAGGAVIVAGVSKRLNGIARRRSWRVEFYPREILFRANRWSSPRVVVPWEDIAWFRDHEAECVQIKLKGVVSSLIDLQVPTTTEQDRAAVLDVLARRGIVRRD